MLLKTARLSTATSRISQVSSQFQLRNMASITQFKLNTGTHIPAIGFGTWQDKDTQENAVTEALKAGYDSNFGTDSKRKLTTY